MISITLNGQQSTVHSSTTITQLLTELDLVGKRVAVELNQEIVTRSNFAEIKLKSGDCVEIVHAIGGG